MVTTDALALKQLTGPAGIDDDFVPLNVVGPIFRANVFRPFTAELRVRLLPKLVAYSHLLSFDRMSPTFQIDDPVWTAFKRLADLHLDLFSNFPIEFKRQASLHYLQATHDSISSLAGDAPAISVAKLVQHCETLSKLSGVDVSSLLFANRFRAVDFTGVKSDWEHCAAYQLPKRKEKQALIRDAFEAAGFRTLTQTVPWRAVAELDDAGSLVAVDCDFASNSGQVRYRCHVLSAIDGSIGPYSVESWWGLRTGDGVIDGLHKGNASDFFAATVALARKTHAIGGLVLEWKTGRRHKGSC